MPLPDRPSPQRARPGYRETACSDEAIAAFVTMMDLARSGVSLAALQPESVHLRVVARLVALHHDLPGLFGAMGDHYGRAVATYVHDREAQRFLLALAEATDERAAVVGLASILASAESLVEGLLTDPTFGWLYTEDRYCLVLSELGARLVQRAHLAS